MNSFNSHSDEAIRTTSAAYLLAVGQLALSEFAALRGIDVSTLLALHNEAVESWAERWGCDPAAVLTEAARASNHLRSFAVRPSPAAGVPRLHA